MDKVRRIVHSKLKLFSNFQIKTYYLSEKVNTISPLEKGKIPGSISRCRYVYNILFACYESTYQLNSLNVIRVPRKTPHIKGVGMLVGNFELNP